MLTRGLSETAESTQGVAEVADDAGACRGRCMRLPGSDADEVVLRVANLCTAVSVPGLSDGDYRGLGDGRIEPEGWRGREERRVQLPGMAPPTRMRGGRLA
jgi:hypothetical protein